MKRAWVLGLFVGAALSGGVFWAVFGGAFFVDTLPSTVNASPLIHIETDAAQQPAQAPNIDPAVQQAPVVDAPALIEKQTLASLSKEEVQTLITLAGQNAIKHAINNVGPAVVQIDVVRPAGSGNLLEDYFRNDPFFDRFRNDQQQERQTTALGSGFFIEYNQQIYLLSNNHVTEHATSIEVRTQSEGTFTARVIGADANMDVSVLKIDDFRGRSVPTVKLGDSANVETGDWVVAIGNPLGLTQTVTAGIISALGRDIPNPNTSQNFLALIQTDAAINPGNSGGPLVNALGEVVGINTLIASDAEGLNFAINIDAVKQALPQLIEDGKLTRAWLGVYIETVDQQRAEELSIAAGEGVLIVDVVRNAPAYGSLHPGDVVTHVDGVRVRKNSELQSEVMFKPIGEPVEMTVYRDGQTANVFVSLGQRPSDEQIAPPNIETQQPELDVETEAFEKFGLRVLPLTESLAEQMGIDHTNGVVVIEVASESRTARANVRQGDVIVELNDQPIHSVADWNATVSQINENEPLILKLLRDGGMVFLVLN